MAHALIHTTEIRGRIDGVSLLRRAIRPWAVAALILSGALAGPLATLRAETPPASPKTSPRSSTPKPTSDSSPAPVTEPSPQSSSPGKQNPLAHWDSVADLEGDALLSKVAALGLLDAKLESLYQNYLRDLQSASKLEASGMGENHPDVRSLRAGLDTQRRQLMDGVNQLKKNAQTVHKLTAGRLAATAIPVFHLSNDQASRFRWGKPTQGLRLALSKPESVGEKETGAVFDYRMIIQNVSDEVITFDLAQLVDQSPRLDLRQEGRTLAAFTGDPHTSNKVVLPPNSAASVPLFHKRAGLARIKAWDPSIALAVEFELAPSPGAWSGRLVSPDTLGLFTGP